VMHTGLVFVRLELVQSRNWSDESEQDEDLQKVRNSVNLLLERIGAYQALSERATNRKSPATHYITSVSSIIRTYNYAFSQFNPVLVLSSLSVVIEHSPNGIILQPQVIQISNSLLTVHPPINHVRGGEQVELSSSQAATPHLLPPVSAFRLSVVLRGKFA